VEPSTRPGHGLTGIAERVALLGGELETGAGAAGGFRLRALLPAATPGA
jgi:signal transduction histidine kinase